MCQNNNSKDVTWRDTGNAGSEREKWKTGADSDNGERILEKENARGFVPASTRDHDNYHCSTHLAAISTTQ